MKRLIFLITLFLTACGSSSAVPTVDPNVQLAVAQAQLTGTAQSWAMQQQYWTATAQSWTPTPSLTPVPTSTPTITFTPTVNVTGTLMVEQMAYEVREMQLKKERAEMTNEVMAFLPYVVIFFAVVLAGWFAYVGSRRWSVMPTPIHEGTGKPMPVMNVLDGVLVDVDRFANGAGQLRKEYLKALPVVTAERQAEVTSRAQLVDLQARVRRLPKQLVDSQGVTSNQFPVISNQLTAGNEAGLFPLPSWELVNGWNFDKDRVPLGNSDRGIEHWDVRNYAHLAIFGRSRTGKSRRSLRPLVALLLASGQRVVLVGKEVDFLPFIGHPNVVFVPVYDVTREEEAVKYFKVLAAAVQEKESRIRLMAQMGHSVWQGERTFMVFDELGNALVDMPDMVGDETLRKARSIANEGGKAGLSLVFSAQRPKGFVDLTTQCGRVVFQVESDQEKGYALGYSGANRLPDVPTGYFYRKFGSVKVTGAFEPTDEQIRDLLSRRSMAGLPKEDWIEGVVSDVNTLPPTPQPATLPESTLTDSEVRSVKALIEERPDASASAIVRTIWNVTGGDRWRKLTKAVSELQEKFNRMEGVQA